MITILAKLLIKNREQVEKTEVRTAYGTLCAMVGIFLNLCLFAGKYLAGFFCGSIAIMADAFNNLSDAGSSLISLAGFRISAKKADADHPFGHGRFEYVSGFLVSMVILLMGIELFKTSAEKIFHPQDMSTGILTGVVLIASILVKAYMCFYNRSIAKKIGSETMKATAMDSLSDSIATLAVLLSMVLFAFTGINLDGYCGCLVALFVLYTGCSAAKDTLNPLLGEPPSKEFVEEIKQIVLSRPEIVGVHDLVVHDYGPGRRMISLHGEVDGAGDIFKLHDAIDLAERELKEKLDCEAVIHMDPLALQDETINRTREEVAAMVKESFTGLSIHDFRMVQGPTHKNLIFDVVVPFGYKRTNEEIKKEITGKINKKWQNYYAVIQVEQSYLE